MYIIIDVMGKNAVVLLPSVQKVLTELGENIKLARLRRGLSSEPFSTFTSVALLIPARSATSSLDKPLLRRASLIFSPNSVRTF